MKGSHLRPLEQKDTKGGGGFRQPWNAAAHEGNDDREEEEEGAVSFRERGTLLNVQSFLREWRRLKSQPHDQYRY